MRRVFFAVVSVISGFLIASAPVFALNQLYFLSDTISTSVPGASATHTIQFTVPDDIPTSGKIIIGFTANQFNIPAAFDYTDVTLSVSAGGPFVDRSLGPVADASNDGVSVVTGTSTTNAITITLNSTTDIAGGSIVRIVLGGTDTITNAWIAQSYHTYIETRDAANALIDKWSTVIVMVLPVTTSAKQPLIAPILSNGLPSGLLAAGNTAIELSVESNIPAHCRYATTTDVLYQNMLNDFNSYGTLLNWGNTYGYVDGQTYTFYIRCISTQSFVANDTDFPITFTIKPTPQSNTSIESEGFVTSGPTGDLGPGGTGDYPNGSKVLYLSSVTFNGLAQPGSTIYILKDGVKNTSAVVHSDGKFTGQVSAIERGAYGFQLYSDNGSLSSALYGTTLSISQGTDNVVNNVIIPPSIKLEKENIGAGETETVSGGAPPNSRIQISVYGQSGNAAAFAKQTLYATSTNTGLWSFDIDTSSLPQGTYGVQASAFTSAQTKSGLSKTVIFALGTATGGSCGKPDMNGDGKVNLVDFSIFLLSWQTADSKADYNCSGLVDLSDFSIMLFNWTG